MAQTAPVTPGRKTHVLFDVPELQLIEPPFSQSRGANDIGQSGSVVTDARLMPGTGWEIQSYQITTATIDEQTTGQSGILHPDGGGLNVAPYFVEAPLHRSPADLPGATAGSTNLAATGNQYVRKQMPASIDWATAVADPLGIPAPTQNAAQATYAMDRVIYTTDEGDPNAALLYRFYFPPGVALNSIFARIYFNAPPTFTPKFVGQGIYCMEFLGDGRAFVYEYGTYVQGHVVDWKPYVVKNLRWADGVPAVGQHSVYLRPFCIMAPDGSFYGGSLSISASQGQPVTAVKGRPTGTLAAPVSEPNISVLTSVATQPTPVVRKRTTIEQARPVRMGHQLSVAVYRGSATIQDAPFSILNFPLRDSNFELDWSQDAPAGTSITAQMYMAHDGTPLTVVTDDHAHGHMEFSIPPLDNEGNPTKDKTGYYVTYTLTTGDTSKTPVLIGYDVNRDGTTDIVAVDGSFQSPSAPAAKLLSTYNAHFSAIGAEDDPTHESAQVTVADLTSTFTRLAQRGEIPVSVRTEYDPNDSTKVSQLFRGYEQRSVRQRKWRPGIKGVSGGAAAYPAPDASEYDVTINGAYQRLQEAISPYRYNFAPRSPSDVRKVTDALRLVLTWGGYDLSHVDVPDLPTPFLPPIGGDTDLLIEPGTNIFQWVQKIAADYLGCYLTFDPNAAPGQDATDFFGMWRIRIPNTPDYTYLHNFVLNVPPAVASVVAHGTAGYPDVLLANGQTVGSTFIQHGSYTSYVLPPEANNIVVSGMGQSELNDQLTITQNVKNYASCNFLGLAPDDPNYPSPDNPDYLGHNKPLDVFDPSFTTPEQLDVVAYRFGVRTFHAQKLFSFEAPLVLVTDPNDTLQCRPRPLKYYDPIKIDIDQTALIRSVCPAYKKDTVQMAVYECEIPPPELQGI